MIPWELGRDDVFSNSDFWLRNASYLRLKNLQISYSFPRKVLDRIGVVNRITIFVNGQNFLTFSDMKDFDPETTLKTNNFFEYPSVKTFSGGINVEF